MRAEKIGRGSCSGHWGEAGLEQDGHPSRWGVVTPPEITSGSLFHRPCVLLSFLSCPGSERA